MKDSLNPVEPLVEGPLKDLLVTRCQAVTRKGTPCPCRPVEDGSFCKAHDPNQADERKRQASQLGQQSAKAKEAKVRPTGDFAFETGADIKAELKRAQGRVRRGESGALQEGHVTARLCSVALEAIKVCDLESQIEELRTMVATITGKKVH